MIGFHQKVVGAAIVVAALSPTDETVASTLTINQRPSPSLPPSQRATTGVHNVGPLPHPTGNLPPLAT